MAVGGDCELLTIETKSFTPRKKEKIEFFRQLTIGRLYVVVFDFFVAAFLMAHSCCAYINKTARPRRNLKLQIEPNVNTEPILCALTVGDFISLVVAFCFYLFILSLGFSLQIFNLWNIL